MKKETKSLSGASQDAYFTRVLKVDPNLTAASQERIVRRLRDAVAQVRLRVNAPRDIIPSVISHDRFRHCEGRSPEAIQELQAPRQFLDRHGGQGPPRDDGVR